MKDEGFKQRAAQAFAELRRMRETEAAWTGQETIFDAARRYDYLSALAALRASGAGL